MPRSLRTVKLVGSRLAEPALRAVARELCALVGLPGLKLEPGMVEVLLHSRAMAAFGRFESKADTFDVVWAAPDDRRKADLAAMLRLWVEAATWCESPIEKLMLWAMLGDGVGALVRSRRSLSPDRLSYGLYVQQPVCGFVADFVLAGMHRPLVIECDGHEFHCTRESLARDRKRDRDLQLAGYTVLRFTGSQIHTDPNACAREVDAHRGSNA